VSGSCPYGKRCCFIHTEVPNGAPPPGADGTPPPTISTGRERSPSTNSDPSEGNPTSLLARLSAKRNQDAAANNSTPTGVSTTPPSTSLGRPGSLRVDTSVESFPSKQNKSAYPTFAHNGVLLPANDDAPRRSPGPVTAAPDFGMHAKARYEIVGTQPSKGNGTSNPRHSYNGGDVQLDFNNPSTPTPTGFTPSQQIGMSPPLESQRAGRVNGHARSGSAGNWGAATRGPHHHLTSYPLSSIPGTELKTNSPWADHSVNPRVSESTWA